MIDVKKNEATAAYRRMYFHCVDATDGMTPETGEVGGQPQVSVNGDAFGTQAIIGVLVVIGNGRYYAELTQAGVNIADRSVIEGRYKSANTAEAVGTTIQIREFPVDASVATRSSHSAADVATLILVDPANDKIDGSKITGVSGTLASQAEVLAIQNNTRVRVIVPAVMERPDTGSTAFKLWLYLYDDIGNMEAPDELPTITARNQAGADRSGNLGVVTLESTGSYSVTYTLASDALIEQLLYEWSIVEGGNTRKHGAASQVVDTTAVDFTTDDRTKLLAIFEDTDETLPAAIGSPMQTGEKVALSDATEEQIDAIETALLRSLGLALENHVEDDIVRDGNGLKTSSKMYLYDSKANATTHDKITGLLAKYTMAATYTDSKLTLFKVVKD